MATQVLMPRLGEAVDEGTITKWLKAAGDKVEQYEALLEINRVLKPGGLAYISEPVYGGEFNDIMRLFHDEKLVQGFHFPAMVVAHVENQGVAVRDELHERNDAFPCPGEADPGKTVQVDVSDVPRQMFDLFDAQVRPAHILPELSQFLRACIGLIAV